MRERYRWHLLVAGGVLLHAMPPPPAVAGTVRSPQSRTSAESSSMVERNDAVRVTKTGDREIAVTGTFAVPRPAMFDAITRPEHLKQWLGASGMSLAEAQVEPRARGGFRYLFRRPNGRTIEVRGAYRSFDPPRGFDYLECYDFSPLEIEVKATLDEVAGGVLFSQTLSYRSTRERDEDFEGVATSSREAYSNLARYLERFKP